MQAIETVGIVILFYSSCTLFVYVSVIRAMILERKQANIVFYTIYMAGSVADIFALINGVFTYCSLTYFLHFTFLRTSLALRISHVIVWGSRFNQLLTVLLIAINRLTAIHYNLRYAFIWTRQSAHVCACIQISSMIVYGALVTHILQPVWTPSSFGGVVAEFSIRTEDIMFSVSLLIQFLMSLSIIICYVSMILGVRSSRRKISLPPYKIQQRNESGLHSIALIICTVEILTLVQHIATAQFHNLSKETKTSLYICLAVMYNSIPPYLIMAFSKSIRHRMLFRHNPLIVHNALLFTAERRESRIIPI